MSVGGHYFGQSIAMSGNTVVVGAPSATVTPSGGGDPLSSAGRMYVFTGSGSSWSEQATLTYINPVAYDYYAYVVDIDADTIVANLRGGGAIAYNRSGSSWNATSEIYPTVPDDSFGSDVAIEGDTVLVGAANEDGAGTGLDADANDNDATGAGALYVFTRNNNLTWTQRNYLKASNTGAGDGFGYAVAISGSRYVSGAPYESSNATSIDGDEANDGASASGAAYVIR
jgi:hypothetical protein